MSNLQAALDFLELHPDTVFFPAFWTESQHKGYIKWSEESSGDPEQLKSWAEKWPKAHFCINRVLSNLTVLDIDNKNGKDGDISLFDLEMEHDTLPETFRSSTPSGGNHIILAGEASTCIGKLGSGIDIPVMIPVPGSVVKGKGEYKITHNLPVAPAPEWIKQKAGEASGKAENRDDILVELDQPQHVADAIAFLQSARPAVEGDGGDNRTYQVACQVRDFGISEATTLQLMFQFWNDRCSPPWDADGLSEKVRSTYQYAQNPTGAATLEAIFSAPVVSYFPDAPTDYDLPKHISAYKGEAPVMDWIIDDWLPAGELIFLTGQGGTGKSRTALQLASSIATGTSWLGLNINRTMPVLVVACEDSDDELHRRWASIRKLEEYKELTEINKVPLYLWSRTGKESVIAYTENFQLKKGKFYKTLCDALKFMEDKHGENCEKLLILDTVSDIFAGNENERTTVNQFIKSVIGGITQRFNCTTITIGHPPKDDKVKYSGSTAWRNAHRAHWFFAMHENENLKDYRTLERAKSNYAATGERIVLHWERGAFNVVNEGDIFDEVEHANKETIFKAILDAETDEQPFGMHHNSPRWFKDFSIKNPEGKELSWEEKKRLVSALKVEGVVEDKKGQKRGNGLYTTTTEYDPLKNIDGEK